MSIINTQLYSRQLMFVFLGNQFYNRLGSRDQKQTFVIVFSHIFSQKVLIIAVNQIILEAHLERSNYIIAPL